MTQTYEQTEAFPRTTLEVLEQLRGVHATALEKAVEALAKLDDDEEIAKRYNKAEEKVAGCRELVKGIDRAIEELHGMEAPATVEGAVRAMHEHAVANNATVTLTAGGESVTLGASVDPITGEVAPTCNSCADREGCNLRMPGNQTGCGGNAWKGEAA